MALWAGCGRNDSISRAEKTDATELSIAETKALAEEGFTYGLPIVMNYDAYPEVIAALGREFTSHEFILKLAKRWQREYVEALYAYRNTLRDDTPVPFMMVHSQLILRLEKLPHLVTKTGECSSRDIFDEQQSCALWRKT